LRGRILALAFLLLAAADRGPEPAVFLGEVEVVTRSTRAFGEEGLRVILEPNDPSKAPFAELAKRLRAGGSEDGKISLVSRPYPMSRDPVTSRHRRPSFLVDYDTEQVRVARSMAESAHDKAPSAADLAQFVRSYITNKNLQRQYDVASVVAKRREGDCTEHAVLLTALARSFGIPARIVHGIALVADGERVRAFGHAWVEYHERAGWQRVDAALPPGLDRVYVPLDVIEEEGPSYGLRMFTGAGLLGLRRILIEDG
jgi:transglutaminase-like putative cysteine protease